MLRYVPLYLATLTLTACPPPPKTDHKPEEPIFGEPLPKESADAGLETIIGSDAGSETPLEDPDAGMGSPSPSEPSDGGLNDLSHNHLGSQTFKRLGTMRGVQSLYGPLASMAINQSQDQTPHFVATEATNDEGDRIINFDFSGSLSSHLDYLPSHNFKETFNAQGNFLSGKWVGGEALSYSCTYNPNNVECTWVNNDYVCTDTYDLTGDLIETDCDTPPGEHMTCTSEVDGNIMCIYSTAVLECHDLYDPEFNRLDSMCMGVGVGVFMNTHGLCMIEPERIICNTDVNTTHCEVVLTNIFNVVSRVCETISHCHWGPEECNSDEMGDCGCSWRDKAREVLCEMGNVDTNDAIPEPDTTGWIHNVLYDETAFDGDRAEIYIDTEGGVFALKITGSGFGGDDSVGPFWYGPFAVNGPMAEDGGLLNCE